MRGKVFGSCCSLMRVVYPGNPVLKSKIVRRETKASYVRSIDVTVDIVRKWDKQLEHEEILWDQLSTSPCPLTEAGFSVE